MILRLAHCIAWFLLVASPVLGDEPTDWQKDAVWYQIFPERFRNGDPSNDPTRDSLNAVPRPSKGWRTSPWTGDWYARAPWEKELGSSFYQDGVLDRRYGGDLQGVIDKLKYLAGLGVNAIYLNPVFYARSLHKYDGSSFHHIDPHFGPDPVGDIALMEAEDAAKPDGWKWTSADKLFLRLLADAHRHGIRVIIDGVWNHTGQDFFAFADIRRNQASSVYREWFSVKRFDDPATKGNEFDYEGWSGFKSLPEFGASVDGSDMAVGPKAYIFAATKRWMDPNGDGNPADGIDGWRLDVAFERPAKFWADWHELVRKLNPAAYTSCEVWDNPRHLIEDGKFGAAMNYFAFAVPVRGFLIENKLRVSEFVRLLDERRAALPSFAAERMQNLIDSHDTERVASMIVNAEINKGFDPNGNVFSRNSSAKDSTAYEVRKPDARERAIQRMVVLFQTSYLGAPMFYYGDESGMWGGNDPDERMPMIWSEFKYAPQTTDPLGRKRKPDPVNFDPGLFRFYRSAISLRRNHAELRRGTVRMVGIFDEQSSVAFLREREDGALLIAMNRSDRGETLRIPLQSLGTWKRRTPRLVFSTVEHGAIGEVKEDELLIELPALAGAVFSP